MTLSNAKIEVLTSYRKWDQWSGIRDVSLKQTYSTAVHQYVGIWCERGQQMCTQEQDVTCAVPVEQLKTFSGKVLTSWRVNKLLMHSWNSKFLNKWVGGYRIKFEGKLINQSDQPKVSCEEYTMYRKPSASFSWRYTSPSVVFPLARLLLFMTKKKACVSLTSILFLQWGGDAIFNTAQRPLCHTHATCTTGWQLS